MAEDNFLDDFDKFSGFKNDDGDFGGEAGFDFDGDDEMKLGGNKTKSDFQPSFNELHGLKFTNPLLPGDNVSDFKSFDGGSKFNRMTSAILKDPPNDAKSFSMRSGENMLKPPVSPPKAKDAPIKAEVKAAQGSNKPVPLDPKLPTKNDPKKATPASGLKSIPSTGIKRLEPAKTNTKPIATPSAKVSKPVSDVKLKPSGSESLIDKKNTSILSPASKQNDKTKSPRLPIPGITLTTVPKLEANPSLSIDNEDFGDDFDQQYSPVSPATPATAKADKNQNVQPTSGGKFLSPTLTPRQPAEPSEQIVLGGEPSTPAKEVETKKNKFLNVHKDEEEFPDDFALESNAISDQVGDELPKVNMEGSGVSNRNFDEKMIETVNSEQIDSKPPQSSPQRTPRKGLKEVPEDSNSNKHNSSPKGEESENKMKASEPLNEPTFLNEGEVPKYKPVKPKPSINDFPSKNPVNKPARPQSSAPLGGNQKKQQEQPLVPQKKARLPDLGLKVKTDKPQLTTADLLRKRGIDPDEVLQRPKQGIKLEENKPRPKTSKPAQELHNEPAVDREEQLTLKDNEDFNKFLKVMIKKTKDDLKEVEDQTKWKPKKFQETSELEVHREQGYKRMKEIQKDLLDPKAVAEDEKLKNKMLDIQKKLEELRAGKEIKYPKFKKKIVSEPEQKAPPQDYRDPVADANNFIRREAWKKKVPEELGANQIKTGNPDQPNSNLFETAEAEQGDNNAPGFAFASEKVQEAQAAVPGKIIIGDFDDKIQTFADIESMPENVSMAFKDGALQTDQKDLLDLSKSNNKFKIGATNHKAGLTASKTGVPGATDHVSTKKKVFEAYNLKQADLKAKDDMIYVEEELEKKLKKQREQQLNGKIKNLEEQFVVEQHREDEAKVELMDKLVNKNKLYRFTQPDKSKVGENVKDSTGKPFRIRVGQGITGELEAVTTLNEGKDIKVRELEIKRINDAKKQMVEDKNREFKERLQREKEFLRKRVELEQERLKELRSQHYKPQSEPTDAKASAAQIIAEKMTVEEDPEEVFVSPAEGEVLEPAGPTYRMKLRHSLKLKSYIDKMKAINTGLIGQIKSRDVVFEDLKRTYEALYKEQREQSSIEKRQILDGMLSRVALSEIYDLLRGENNIIRVAQANKMLRETAKIYPNEKKVLREYLMQKGDELITYNRLESLLSGEEPDDTFKITKGPKEIEADKKLLVFLLDLEDYERQLDKFKARVETRQEDSFEAHNEILRLKKQQARHLQVLTSMMGIIINRADELMSRLEAVDSDQDFVGEFEKLQNANTNKLKQVDGVYADALNDFDVVDGKMKNIELFGLEEFEELNRKENDMARAAYESANRIHALGFKEKNVVLDFLAITSKKKKSALLIQAWFRGWKARRLYGVKRTFRQRMWFMANRWLRRFRRRLGHKIIADLTANLEVSRLRQGLSMIKGNREVPQFDRGLHPLTLKFIHAQSMWSPGDTSSRNRPQLNSINASQMAPTHTQESEETSVQGEADDLLSEEDQKSTIEEIEGQKLFYAIILQRLYRQCRNKTNPEQFWVSESTMATKCRLCHIHKIRIVVPDNNIGLMCWKCFEEMNKHRKRYRVYRLLRLRRHEAPQLSEHSLKTGAQRIYAKIQLVRDFDAYCTAWDTDQIGSIEIGDLDFMIERLKMITSSEKALFQEWLLQHQLDGRVDYREIIENLSKPIQY